MNAQLTPDAATSTRFYALSKVERSCLCYLESCAVDQGGLVEQVRMNKDDFDAIEKFKGEGLLRFGRIKARLLLDNTLPKDWTHWVVLTAKGWELASRCRLARAQQHGPFATKALTAAGENYWADAEK